MGVKGIECGLVVCLDILMGVWGFVLGLLLYSLGARLKTSLGLSEGINFSFGLLTGVLPIKFGLGKLVVIIELGSVSCSFKCASLSFFTEVFTLIKLAG